MHKPIHEIANSLGWPKQHMSVGAIIQRAGKYLMIERNSVPFGKAGVAGHVDAGEERDLEGAIAREVDEEVDLRVVAVTPVPEIQGVEVLWNHCRSAKSHRWHLYYVATEGEPRFDPVETKGGGWFTPEELASSALEPVWREWLERLKIIPRQPRVTICGSMSFAAEMAAAAETLRARGWQVVAPSLVGESADGSPASLTDQFARSGGARNAPRALYEKKAEAIRDHFRWVSWCDVVLIWNPDKKGVDGYVGPNTFAEVLFGSGWLGKTVVALYPFSDGVVGCEELVSCCPEHCLHGDLAALQALRPLV